ncbi:hypothetical protein QF034_006116 [Streptomyces africanus]|uniref:Uncharacterized protein n=1 Tax=Streptomyces africanus TaxID=231024 RepID=A0ABU0QXZ1_9ACTN|nr:hypothetical protein [Streptomyces africanus]
MAELHFLGDDFPAEHPYADRVYAVPGPAQDRLNGVTPPTGRLPVWLLGSSGYSAHALASLWVGDETIRNIRSGRSHRGHAVCGQLPRYSAIDELGCGNGHRKCS